MQRNLWLLCICLRPATGVAGIIESRGGVLSPKIVEKMLKLLPSESSSLAASSAGLSEEMIDDG